MTGPGAPRQFPHFSAVDCVSSASRPDSRTVTRNPPHRKTPMRPASHFETRQSYPQLSRNLGILIDSDYANNRIRPKILRSYRCTCCMNPRKDCNESRRQNKQQNRYFNKKRSPITTYSAPETTGPRIQSTHTHIPQNSLETYQTLFCGNNWAYLCRNRGQQDRYQTQVGWLQPEREPFGGKHPGRGNNSRTADPIFRTQLL